MKLTSMEARSLVAACNFLRSAAPVGWAGWAQVEIGHGTLIARLQAEETRLRDEEARAERLARPTPPNHPQKGGE